jgi:hypothetical protein
MTLKPLQLPLKKLVTAACEDLGRCFLAENARLSLHERYLAEIHGSKKFYYQGAAVSHDQGAYPAIAQLEDFLGQPAFTSADFTLNEDTTLAVGRDRQDPADMLDIGVGGDEVLERAILVNLIDHPSNTPSSA